MPSSSPAALSPHLPPGRGEIDVKHFLNSTSVTTLSSTYPLRLFSRPIRPPLRAALIFTLTYGGGIVAGDLIDLRVTVRKDARLVLLTQGSTKIYKTPSKGVRSAQDLTVKIEPGASLVLLPDPVQPFKESAYLQRQVFHIDPTLSNLILLDWMSEGRSARGERWDFWEWEGRNEIWSHPIESNGGVHQHQKGKLLLRDNIRLGNGATFGPDPREQMYSLGVFGTLIIKGPMFRGLGKLFLDEFSHLPRIGTTARVTAQPQASPPNRKPDPDPNVIWTAASIRGFVVIKFGGTEVDELKGWLRGILSREGTVPSEFGEHALMCLR